MAVLCRALVLHLTVLLDHKKNVTANLYIFAPHSSMFDIAVLFKLGVTAAVARDEVRNLWIFSSEKLYFWLYDRLLDD